MGFVELIGATLTTSASPRESERFGVPTSRTTVGANSIDAAGDLMPLAEEIHRQIERSSATINILRYPSRMTGLFRELNLPGKRVLPAGALIYWGAPGQRADTASSQGTEVLSFARRSEWLPEVMSVVADSFEGYTNHYAVNPLIPATAVVEGYSEWAAATIASATNVVIAAKAATGEVVGVAVIAVAGAVWEIELASVSQSAQRQGHYTRLMHRVLAESHKKGASQVVISTQSHNIAVQQAWVKLGLIPMLSIDTVHIINLATAGWGSIDR